MLRMWSGWELILEYMIHAQYAENMEWMGVNPGISDSGLVSLECGVDGSLILEYLIHAQYAENMEWMGANHGISDSGLVC